MADINTVAKQFTDFYYESFARDRAQLAPLYREHSMLSWEGQIFGGTNGIIEKFAGLPFQKVAHKVTTFDAQPSPSGSIIVLVTGLLLVDDSTNPLQFSEVFHLVPDGGSYYVFNDIFRLNYG